MIPPGHSLVIARRAAFPFPKTAIATLANLQSEDLALQKAFPRGKNFSFAET
jgi:hypothetical protein